MAKAFSLPKPFRRCFAPSVASALRGTAMPAGLLPTPRRGLPDAVYRRCLKKNEMQVSVSDTGVHPSRTDARRRDARSEVCDGAVRAFW
jgi:hypothetical protein